MVQRHRKSGFLPNAWVFPGGRVESQDRGLSRVRGGETVLAQMGLGRELALAYLTAGVRETFEESGIWLGEPELDGAARDGLNAGSVEFSSVLERFDAHVDLDVLRQWSWWITPREVPRRYDTRFMVAVTESASGVHDEHETVDSGWFSPREVLGRASLVDFPMAPPTWWTLRELATYGSPGEVLEAAERRPQRPIEPRMQFGTDGMLLVLPGHPTHSSTEIEGVPTHVTYEGNRWVAWRHNDRL